MSCADWATRYEFFFTKIASTKGITDIALLDFWLCNTALLNVYFILHYRLFFCKEKNFFRMFFMAFGWERDHPLYMYERVGIAGDPKWTQLRTGGGLPCTYKNIYIILKTEGPYFIHYITFHQSVYSVYNLIYFYITDNVTFLTHLLQHISHSGSGRRYDSD